MSKVFISRMYNELKSNLYKIRKMGKEFEKTNETFTSCQGNVHKTRSYVTYIRLTKM